MNELFDCIYDPQRFHCVHFVIQAAQVLYQKDYAKCFIGLTGTLDETLQTSRSTVIQNKRLEKPIEGCIILMTYFNGSSHCGLFFRQRIFHLCEFGVQRLTLEQAQPMFKRIRFYEPNLTHS